MKIGSLMKLIITALAFLFAAFAPALAQFEIKMEESKITINGTSNLHNWSENVEIITGRLDAEILNGSLAAIKALSLAIPATSIKSGNSLMDRNTYKALKADKHPEIYFELSGAELSGFKASIAGNLAVAGVTRAILVNADVSYSDGAIVLKGEHRLRMTDFGIKPPAALFGALRTGDEVAVVFKLAFAAR